MSVNAEPSAKSCGCRGANSWYPAKNENGRLIVLEHKKMTRERAIARAKQILEDQ